MMTAELATLTLLAITSELAPYRTTRSYTCHKEYKANLVPRINKEYMEFKLDPLYGHTNGTGTIDRYTRGK